MRLRLSTDDELPAPSQLASAAQCSMPLHKAQRTALNDILPTHLLTGVLPAADSRKGQVWTMAAPLL